ncbi:fluoride export protein 1-like [Rutidosis leptorrhynchoides]|uniref:fluoride export protein 1-like n=1 Tax=Rutidosis leptorrhynchoides TaxID=125765 RepID=UPI003A998F01
MDSTKEAHIIYQTMSTDHSNTADEQKSSGSSRPRYFSDDLREDLVFPIQQHSVTNSQVPNASHDSSDTIVRDEKQNDVDVGPFCTQGCKKELSWFLVYISSTIHLAVFGILGVLTRYLLEKLFGPEVVGVTSDHSVIYVDLPPNMVGSFLMGWLGVVFKGDISKLSPDLAVGLTTGYLGSLTTFSGWNQKMIELSVDDQWTSFVVGFSLGFILVFCSFLFGVGTVKGFRWVLNKTNLASKCGFFKVHNVVIQSILIVVMIMMLGLLWGMSVFLLTKDLNGDNKISYVWFGCIIGPIGVWIRFYLTKLNGKGLGRTVIMKWMPFGTLIANVSACCIMAAFAIMKKAVNDNHFDIVATGIQFGLCGCLSTVSTFIAEFEAIRESVNTWRECLYALTTIIISFTFGTLIYSVPV